MDADRSAVVRMHGAALFCDAHPGKNTRHYACLTAVSKEIGIFFASALDIWDQIVHNNSRFSQNDLILFCHVASKRFD